MKQPNVANRISMLGYWKPLRGICLYLRNYPYESVSVDRIVGCWKSPKTGIWYVEVTTLGRKYREYRIDDIILIRKLSPKFTTLDLICHGRKKMFDMRKAGTLD